jgi:hypothetical protein
MINLAVMLGNPSKSEQMEQMEQMLRQASGLKERVLDKEPTFSSEAHLSGRGVLRRLNGTALGRSHAQMEQDRCAPVIVKAHQ